MKTDLVIPVLNEQGQLASTVRRLLWPGISGWPEDLRVTIVDNGSSDGTPEIGQALAAEHPRVHYMRLEERGRGRALKLAWMLSDAPIVAYMDVDLSTELAAFPRLLKPLTSGRADIAIGCRNHPAARVIRGLKREFISRGYNRLARLVTGTRIRDLQCGFKVLTQDAVKRLLPLVEDTGWFFDTELLLIAEHLGYRIHEEPVSWIDDPDSRVRLLHTAWEDWKGLLRMRRALRLDKYPRRLEPEVHATV